MVAQELTAWDQRVAGENQRLRELLKQWVRLERFSPSRPEFDRLIEATKRALLRDDPDWAEYE